MKKFQIAALLSFVLLLGQTMFAQSTGTVTVTGTTPEAFAITSTTDGTLSSTVALGTLTPAAGGTLSTGTIQARLRSNKAYTLTAQATSLSVTSPGSADGGSSISLSDIGFGVTAIDATGANVAGSHSDTIVSKFNYTPSGFNGLPSVTNGLTPFVSGTHGTLNDVTSATQVVSGTRISSKGNMSTNNNFLLITFTLGTLPQFFTPNAGFSTTITLTMATQ